MRRRWGLAVVAVLAAGCTSDGQSLNFTKRLEDGADCGELFEIRNRIGMETERYNRQLREIGCYSATSERTD
jgi:hypothetical protein